MELKLKGFLINGLRRLSYKWPPRNEAKRAARIERNQYECAGCKKIFTNAEVVIDHINPVVALSGFTNWDDYVNRMFCEFEGFQILCDPCHDSKTVKENSQRKRKRTKKRKVNRKNVK